jgi:ADP-ribose pyrophosphatase YjhB (NUDIX family)
MVSHFVIISLMAGQDFPLTQKEFSEIYAKVPRLTVEVIVKNEEGAVYLTKRAVEPCKGQWHLPGGTVRFAEPMTKAIKRIAKRELNIDVEKSNNVGYIEYPSHYSNGLDSPVGIVFEVMKYKGECKPNDEAREGSWHSKVPKDMHKDQDVFLLTNGYLRR